MSDDRTTGGALRRRLRGSLDLPLAAVTDPTAVEVAGWTHHDQAEVLLVVVMADGRVVGTAERSIARPDVVASHPTAGRPGWSVVVDLGRVRDQVTLSAHALVSVPVPDGQPARTVLLPFAERTLEVVGGGVVRGHVDLPEECAPGTLLVAGRADISPALARVEVSVDGGSPVRARHSLPSGPDRAAGADGRLGGFAAVVELPGDRDEVDVRVEAVATDGTRAALPTSPVQVRHPEPAGDPDERRRVLDERLARHVEVLRTTYPRGRRVLVAAHDLGLGGAQGYLDDLMQGLHEQGLEFCVVAGSDGPLLDHVEQTYGAPVLVVGSAPEDPETLHSRVRLIAEIAAEHGAGACLANTMVAFPAVLAARRLGIPVAWAIHESFTPAVFWHEYLGRPAHPEVLAATIEALAGSDEVLFVAESTRRLFAGLVPDGASATVHYGLDLTAIDRTLAASRREQVRHELDIPLDRRVLLCVGSVEPRKAQLALARAFGRLGAVGEHASLHIVGARDTAYVRALRDYVHDAGLDRVHVVDADPDIMRWYLAADVLVSAADVESMPRTMLEAMAASRPVAAAASFGVAELVEDGVSGWLCPTGDLAELTDVLRRAVTAGTTRLASMGAAGRAHVETHHAATGYIEHVGSRLRGWLAADGGRP